MSRRTIGQVTQAGVQVSARTTWPKDLQWAIEADESSRIVLITATGRVALTSSYHCGLRLQERAVDDLNAFFQGHGNRATVVVRPSAWLWAAVGSIWVVAFAVIFAAPVRCTLDREAAQITIERGLLRRKKVVYPFAQVERIAIRQQWTPSYDSEHGLNSLPEVLQPPETALVLALVMKTGGEITVLEGIPGGVEGLAIARAMEKFRRGLAANSPTGAV